MTILGSHCAPGVILLHCNNLCSPIKILGWCPAEAFLAQIEKMSLWLWLATLLVMFFTINTLWGRCFITLTSLTPQLFLLVCLKLILLLDQLRLH